MVAESEVGMQFLKAKAALERRYGLEAELLGAGELREMCQKTYESAGYKCESNLEYYSYYGKNEQGCEKITELLPAKAAGSGGKVFGWIVFILVIGGVGAYVVWWRKSKFTRLTVF